MGQNESTRKEIELLRDASDWNELTKRLGSRIEFGTAGEDAILSSSYIAANLTSFVALQDFERGCKPGSRA